MRFESVLDAIGHTPTVRLRMPATPGVACYAKLEMQNLFAMKDRVARNILLRARERGDLCEGAPVVESSSGTMALGVALVASELGHPVHIVTDPRIDRITLAKLESLGCTVHVVPEMDEHGWQGARLTRLAEVMADNPGSFWPRQYHNPDNPAAYRAMATELLDDLGRVDVLVGSVGSGGSLCGTARALREVMPALRVVGVDCAGSVLFGQPDRPQRLQSGLGNSMHPPNLDHSQIDEVHWLNDREAFAATVSLAREQTLFAGNTSGSVYRVMGAVAADVADGGTVVGVFPDRGDRYFDTVHNPAHWSAHGLDDEPLEPAPRSVSPTTVVDRWSRRPGGGAGPAGIAAARPADPDGPPVVAFVESNTTGTGMAAIDVARRLGYRPLFLTDSPQRYPGLDDTGCEVRRCDTADPRALAAALTSTVPPDHVAAVLSTSEFFLADAARLAGALGRPGEDPDAVERCRDKSALREQLDRAGVRQPDWVLVHSTDQVAAAVDKIGLPCVVKPIDESGSTGVRRCDTATEATDAAEAVLAVTENTRGRPKRAAALLESHLDGPEFSVETFGVDGVHRHVAVVEKSVSCAPYFVESRHLVPASLGAADLQAVQELARAALTAAGLRFGASHTEIRLTSSGPALVEINPRLAGGMIPELIRLASGVDLLEQQVRNACGLQVTLDVAADRRAGIAFLTAPGRGVLDEVHGDDDARAMPGVERVTLTVAPGRRVAPAEDAYGRLGYVIATGSTRDELVGRLTDAVGTIRTVVV